MSTCERCGEPCAPVADHEPDVVCIKCDLDPPVRARLRYQWEILDPGMAADELAAEARHRLVRLARRHNFDVIEENWHVDGAWLHVLADVSWRPSGDPTEPLGLDDMPLQRTAGAA